MELIHCIRANIGKHINIHNDTCVHTHTHTYIYIIIIKSRWQYRFLWFHPSFSAVTRHYILCPQRVDVSYCWSVNSDASMFGAIMSCSLFLQQSPACLVRLTLMVFEMGGKWSNCCCFVECCFGDFFKRSRSTLLSFHSSFSSWIFVSIHKVHPYSSICFCRDVTEGPFPGRFSEYGVSSSDFQHSQPPFQAFRDCSNAPSTTGITVTHMIYSFLSSLAKSK